MTGDLRSASPETFWTRLREAMGRDGLLTYRYFGRRTAHMHGADHDSMSVRRDMRNPQGGLTAAALSVATAEVGGFTDFNAVPAPVVASLSILDPGADVAELRIVRDDIHVGRTMGFSRSVVTDAADPSRIIAVARSVGVKLGEAPAEVVEPLAFDEPPPDDETLPPLHEVFGGYRREDGVWELPALSAASRSTSGSLHLGPIHVICEAAAMDALSRLAPGGRPQVEEWEVQFVARGLIGPFEVLVEPGADTRAGRCACLMTLKDVGKAGRTVAAATAVFRL